jgi:hypothetical protein
MSDVFLNSKISIVIATINYLENNSLAAYKESFESDQAVI